MTSSNRKPTPLSQQIEHPVLQAIRSSPLGHIAIGSDFDTRDLIAYTTGIAAALLVDTTFFSPGNV